MSGKITLISPPDIFENSNLSILFMHLSDADQDIVSKWLGKNEPTYDINVYFYNGEPNTDWILYASAVCEYKYIDMNYVNYITQALSGHLLSKYDFHYKLDDTDLSDVYQKINNKKIDQIETFLESVFLSAKRN